jgi:nucleoside-diphosphate-sugar epimerase
MNILVTGNMGYIGPVLTRHLREKIPQVRIIGYDTGFFATCLTGTNVIPEVLVDLQYFGDIREISHQVLEGMDVVVHLAAISNDPMGNAFEEVTYDVNYRASIELAKRAKRAGINTFVFASSCSMYGYAEEGAKTEQSELNPLTAYAKSKVYTEKELKNLSDEKFKITCLRFATACGMSERLRLDLVLNDFVAGAVAAKKITILSDGTPWRPLIDVKDMARAIEWAIIREIDCGGNYVAVNAGSNRGNYQVKELASSVAEKLTNVNVSINKDAAPDKRSYRVNFDLFKKLAPEHQPKIELDQTIQELIEGLNRMNFRDHDFRSSRLMRLKVLNELLECKVIDKGLYWINKR